MLNCCLCKSTFYTCFSCQGAAPTGGLIVVDVDPLELQVGVAVVRAGRVDAMLVRDHLPELEMVIKHSYYNSVL